MLTITSENAKQIRTPLEIYSTFTAREEDTDLTFSILAGSQVEAKDLNLSETLDDSKIPMRILADLSGDGFSMDGLTVFADSGLAGNETNGKIGLRTATNGTVNVQVVGSKRINALTVAIVGGAGTITCSGKEYDARRIVVIPVDANSTNITFTATNDTRLDIASITAGLVLEFSTENIISCTLALRSNLDIVSPSWQVSDFEIQAYYPSDLSAVVSNIGDDVPITYYAGYDGDYSPVRTFYLSEKAVVENNVITLRGEDISKKLDGYTLPIMVEQWKNSMAMSSLYNKFYSVINSALGGKFPITKQPAPATNGTSTAVSNLVFREQSARDFVANVMNIAHTELAGVGFYPVFVDAGIPTIRWEKPTAKWHIFEEDCGDVAIEYDRNINRVISEDGTYDIETSVSISQSTTTFETISVTAGTLYTNDFDDFVMSPSVTNASVISASASRLVWEALKSTTSKKKTVKSGKKKTTTTVYSNQSTVKGRKASVTNGDKAKTINRAGVTATVQPNTLGKLYCSDTGNLLFPNWENLFEISNVTGSFKWKGDPRMQPRDVFKFHRLDGTVEDCTIETITLSHEGGGLMSEITYRKGIV